MKTTKQQSSGYKYIFGPVPSRRLGISLGVDLMPHKTCTLNCVYCECGKTTHLTLKRKEYVSIKLIQEELKSFLSGDPELDFITFSGSGEPTLNTGIEEITGFIKSDYPQYKVALLTNGTLLFRSDVRKQIRDVDILIASLDAASEKNFISINRPHPELELSRIIDGLIFLKEEFKNRLWIETFIIPGLNDNKIELKKIKKVLKSINPDRIQLNTLDRPGTERWVAPADKKVLMNIAEALNKTEIITLADSGPEPENSKGDCLDGLPANDFGRVGGQSLTGAGKRRIRCRKDGLESGRAKSLSGKLYRQLLSTIKRRPVTAKDVSEISGICMDEVYIYLDTLIKNGEIKKKQMPRGTFYMVKNRD